MAEFDRPLDRVLTAFGVDPAAPVEPVATGLLNRSWRVAAVNGLLVLRQTLDIGAEQIRLRQCATAALAADGLPVAGLVPTVDGATLLEDPAGLFEATAWIDGEHRRGAQLGLTECADLGGLIARMHATLAPALPSPQPGGDTGGDTGDEHHATDAVDRVARAIEGLSSRPDPGSQATARRLRDWRARLHRLAPSQPTGRLRWPVGWTHGDLQPLNLLWSAGVVVGILDFDQLGRRRYADELVRSAMVLFGPDLDRVAAFAGGYRRRRPLDRADIADTLHLTWWRRLEDLCACVAELGGEEPAGFRAGRTAARLEAMLGWWCDRHDAVLDALT